MENRDYDLIIVGAGAAGTSAALSAAERAKASGKNLRIAILERTGESDWGGNSRYTNSYFRMTDEEHLYPTFEEDIMKDSKGKANRDYVHRLALEAVSTIGWVRSKGVKLQVMSEFSVANFALGPVGGGLAIITALRSHAEKLGVSILLETTAYKLIQDETGTVNGIMVRDRDGKTKKLACSAVILAGGGFEGNIELLTRYISREAASLRMDVPATKFHMGECMTMAFEIGAAPSGEFGSYHGDAVDVRSDGYRPIIRSHPFGISVNSNGERFIDEGMDEMNGSFEFMARAIFNQPGHNAFFIFDKKARSIPNFDKNNWTKFPPYEAETLEELARIINLLPARLIKTLDEFNRSVQPGEFNPTKRDNKHTEGIIPAKTNWALTIDESPYFAYPVDSTVQFTWGGLSTDSHARVLASNGSPIAGLYAAGELVGLYYHHYTPGTSVMRALTYGRIAGTESANWISSK
ncbi:MAG: FAD-binding protein [Nitrososphaerales archaeon]